MEIVIPVNQSLQWVDEEGDPRTVEYTKARLDFRAGTIELPTRKLLFADVPALWKAIRTYGQGG